MTPALLLIDLQHDYLAAPDLQPAAGQVIDRAAAWLSACRRKHLPIIHVYTTVSRNPDNRMPHWKSANHLICQENTPGHSPPVSLIPLPGEPIFHKQFFSAFSAHGLRETISTLKIDTIILAGIHLHACIRATALDAYQTGLSVLIADDAVASDDPLHAAITRRYLSDRSIQFIDIQAFTALALPSPALACSKTYQHHAPFDQRFLWDAALSTPDQISKSAAELQRSWSSRLESTMESRAATLRELATRLLDHQRDLAHQIATDVGKPIHFARAEVHRSAQLLQATAAQASLPTNPSTTPTICRRMPLGVIATITPWNNPLAIPIGKIVPALFYDNAVLWKPALPATAIAQRLFDLWKSVDPTAPLALMTGGSHAARLAAQDPSVDAITLSGSLQAGYALAEVAARRHVPYQAELGGNNACIVAQDADLKHAASEIATGAFSFAGQRCTANRRAILVGDNSRLQVFLADLSAATRLLPVGDPLDESTRIGPVITPQKRDQLLALLRRAHDAGLEILTPHQPLPAHAQAAFLPPAIVIARDPHHEIVQEESFGPILVVQPAESFDQALHLANSVRQGLVAACFTRSPERQEQFLRTARAGILKLNQSTADADATSPFGGWKASGIGPPEHGPADLEFFTRAQTAYP